MRCLVIEDELTTSRYICKGLREARYSVTAAENGVEGLYLATTAAWDVIVLDRALLGIVDGINAF